RHIAAQRTVIGISAGSRLVELVGRAAARLLARCRASLDPPIWYNEAGEDRRPGAHDAALHGAEIGHRAVPAGIMYQVLLDEEVAAAEVDIGGVAVGSGVGSAKGPRAAIGVLAAGVDPGIEVGVGDCLLELVDDDARHGVSRGAAVGSAERKMREAGGR